MLGLRSARSEYWGRYSPRRGCRFCAWRFSHSASARGKFSSSGFSLISSGFPQGRSSIRSRSSRSSASFSCGDWSPCARSFSFPNEVCYSVPVIRKRTATRVHEIAPDEIFLDSSNLPGRDEPQFEGRVVASVSPRALLGVGGVFLFVVLVCVFRSFALQVAQGASYAGISRDNRLEQSVEFATRGLILDRTGKKLAWNEAAPAENASTTPFALRRYSTLPGLSHILGFVRYPKADARGTWWREEYTGVSGAELAFNDTLAGKNGSTMVETDARGRVQEANIIAPPLDGTDLKLSIDSDVESKLYTLLSAHARKQGFQGGASVVMDVRTGEILALASFPEYDNAAFTNGNGPKIRAASNDALYPLLDRAIAGLYAPGSIVKPIFAAAELNEKLISPDKQILSTGAISIPNPYDPSRPSLFRDWTVHGWIDMRTALAVSSDEYFYTIGGGYGLQ